jgi:NADPH-dependent glutamate synthase beta subunit-like oxidoreductase
LDNSNFDLVDKLHEKDEIIGLLKHENRTFKQDRDHARHRIDELEREIIKINAINPGANVTKSSREEMIKTPIGLVSQT